MCKYGRQRGAAERGGGGGEEGGRTILGKSSNPNLSGGEIKVLSFLSTIIICHDYLFSQFLSFVFHFHFIHYFCLYFQLYLKSMILKLLLTSH